MLAAFSRLDRIFSASFLYRSKRPWVLQLLESLSQAGPGPRGPGAVARDGGELLELMVPQLIYLQTIIYETSVPVTMSVHGNRFVNVLHSEI